MCLSRAPHFSHGRAAREGDRRRRRRHRADLRRAAARGRPPGRRRRARPAAGDDLGRRGRVLVPLPGPAAGPGHRLGADDVRRLRRARRHRSGVRGADGARHRRPAPCRTAPETRGGARPCRRWSGVADGWSFTTPVADTSVYLDWLAGRVEAARRHDHPAQPGRPAAGARQPGRQLLGSRRPAARRRPHRRPRARTGGPRRAVRAGPLVARRVGSDVPGARVEHDVVVGGTDVEGEWSRTASAGGDRGDPRAGRAAGARGARCARPAAHGSGCGRCGRRCGSSGSATSCTATATAARGSP